MSKNLSLKAIITAARPISWPNTAVPFAVGYYLSGSAWGVAAWLALFFFIFPYNLLVYGINDVFDYESDVLNPRKGGVEGGLLTPQQNRQLLSATMLITAPFIVALVLVGSYAARLWLLLIVLAALAYSLPGLRFKEKPLLDSFTSSTHFYSPFVYGLLLGTSSSFFWSGLVAFGLWGMASHAFGAIQDVKSDKQGGLQSIATVMGVRFTVWFSTALYGTATLLLAAAYGRAGWLAAVIVSLYAFNAVRFCSITEKDSPLAHAGWRLFLQINMYCGFLLTMVFLAVYNPLHLVPSSNNTFVAAVAAVGGLVGLVYLYAKHIDFSARYFIRRKA